MGLGVGAAWVSGGARDMAGSACPFSPVFHSGHSRAPRRGIWAPMGVMGSAGSPCVPGGIPGLLACCPHPGLPLGGCCERRPVRPPWTGHCPRCHKAHVWSSLRAGFPAGGVGPPGPELGAPGSCAHAWPLAASPPKPRWSPQRPRTSVAGALAGLGWGFSWVWRLLARTWASGPSLCASSGWGVSSGGSHLFWLQQQVSGTAAPHRDPQAQRPLARPADAFPLPCRPGGPSGPASPRPGGHALSGGQRLADCHGKRCLGCRGSCFLSRCL